MPSHRSTINRGKKERREQNRRGGKRTRWPQ